jgi:hypothetical protein
MYPHAKESCFLRTIYIATRPSTMLMYGVLNQRQAFLAEQAKCVRLAEESTAITTGIQFDIRYGTTCRRKAG